MNKIRMAYARGGPSLLVETVENLTALRIDHFAKVDFAGFRQGDRSVVHLEEEHCRQLWESLRTGAMAAYVDQHTDDTLGPVTR